MLRVARLHCGSVVVVDGQSADDAVVGTFLQHYHSMMHGLAVIFLDGARLFRLGQHDAGAVALFAHQYDVRTVDDDFLLIESFADEYLEGLLWLQRSLLDGGLNAFAGIHYGIKVFHVLLGLAEHVDESVLVGSFRIQADAQLVLRVILVCPLVVEWVELAWAAAKPGIAVAALMSDVFQSAARQSVAVADIGLAVS